MKNGRIEIGKRKLGMKMKNYIKKQNEWDRLDKIINKIANMERDDNEYNPS